MIMEISPEFVEGATRRFVMRGVQKESVLVLVSFLLVGHPSAFYDQMGPDKRFDAAEVRTVSINEMWKFYRLLCSDALHACVFSHTRAKVEHRTICLC